MIHFPDDPKHPMYGFMVHCLSIASLTIVLYRNAEDFDITEYKSILGFSGAYITLMGGRWLAGWLKDKTSGS